MDKNYLPLSTITSKICEDVEELMHSALKLRNEVRQKMENSVWDEEDVRNKELLRIIDCSDDIIVCISNIIACNIRESYL